MAFRLFKCKESEESYTKAQQPYPDHMQDQLYQHHCELIQHDEHKREIIRGLTRVKAYNGNEYLVYSAISEGHDRIYGKLHQFFRSGLGKYTDLQTETINVINEEFQANPTAATDIDFDISGKPKNASNISAFKTVTNIIGEREAFSIPFTKEAADKLHKKCIDKEDLKKATIVKPEEVTSYAVAKQDGIAITITDTYEHWRDGDFGVLFHYGCLPSLEDKRRIDAITADRVNRYSSPEVLSAAAAATTSSLSLQKQQEVAVV